MNKKSLLIIMLAICSLFGTMQASPALALEEAPPTCNCDELAPPQISYTINTDTCAVTFTATPDDCLIENNIPLSYSWSINGGAYSSTGAASSYAYEDVDDVLTVQARVVEIGSLAFCDMYSEEKDMSSITCALSGDVTVEKEAFSALGGVPITGAYVNQQIRWVVTVTNGTSAPITRSYVDFWPDGSDDVWVNADLSITNYTHPACPFEIVPGLIDIELNDSPSTIIDPSAWDTSLTDGDGYNISGDFLLNPGDKLEIIFYAFSCDSGDFTGETFTNCFKLIDFTDPVNWTSEDTCDSLNLRRGCPIGMSDGYCLQEEDITAGSIINSRMNGHTRFKNIKRATGIIEYDHTKLAPFEIELAPIVESTHHVVLNDNGEGLINFTIEQDAPGNFFNIAPPSEGGSYQPFEVNGTLINNLTDCTYIGVFNFVIESIIPGEAPTSIYVDPGAFCADYSINPNYESAILEPEGGFTCLAAGESVVINLTGPFDTQHEFNEITWSTGEEDVTNISVSEGGFYEVFITDYLGCERYASITIEGCEEECVCNNINPVIVTEVSGCTVDASVIMPACSNISYINYKWVFRNGFEYIGENPPPTNLVGPEVNPDDVKLTITYSLDNSPFLVCSETVTKDVSIFCKGSSAKMYPNPAQNYMTLELLADNLKSGTILFLDTIGNEVKRDVFTRSEMDKTVTCDVSMLKQGLYFVQILDKDRIVIETKRLAIK